MGQPGGPDSPWPPPGATPGQQPYGPPPGQPPYGTPPGQPPYGTPPGQPYRAYQPYPTSPAGPGYKPARDPALAEWWQRLVARIIDGIILAILISPVWISLAISMYHRIQRIASQYPDLSLPGAQQAFTNSVNRTMGGMIGTFLLVGVATSLISFGYDWLQHGLWGQTIGKRMMGTKVVTADAHSPISGGAACGRAAVYALIPSVPSVGALFGLINELWLLWDPQRQCLHDKAARTVVVKVGML